MDRRLEVVEHSAAEPEDAEHRPERQRIQPELANPLGGDVLDLVGANATLTHREAGPSSEMRFVLP